jgi:hypothetical protein
MLRRICKICGRETIPELTPEGRKFLCEICNDYPMYDELDMEPHCPECGEQLEVHVKCGTGFFCNKCRCLKSRKNIDWREKTP